MLAAASFLFGGEGSVAFGSLLGLIVGSSLVIASSCVINNLLDSDIDALMERTRKRALVTGDIKPMNAIRFAVLLGLTGYTTLLLTTNKLTFGIAALAMFVYTVVYTRMKRNSVHAALVGTVAGALPPVAGYTAATNRLDFACVCLFAVLTAWQMAHFLSIAVYRYHEYQAAGVPVFPLVRGLSATQRQVVFYILASSVFALMLTVFGHTGLVFSVAILMISIFWLQRACVRLTKRGSHQWGRQVFRFSLFTITSFSLLLALNPWIP